MQNKHQRNQWDAMIEYADRAGVPWKDLQCNDHSINELYNRLKDHEGRVHRRLYGIASTIGVVISLLIALLKILS